MALKPTMLYLIGQRNGEYVLPYCKIGIATDVKTRLSSMNTGSPFECFVYRQHPFKERVTAVAVESAILSYLEARHVRGEWVSGTPEEILPLVEHLLVDRMPVGYVPVKRKRAKAIDGGSPEPRRKPATRTYSKSEWLPYSPSDRRPKLKPETIARIRHTAESSRLLLR